MQAEPVSPLGNQGPSPPLSAVQGAAQPANPSLGQIQIAKEASSPPPEPVLLEVGRRSIRPKRSDQPLSLEEATKKFREFLKQLPSDLLFSADQDTGQVIFKVINPLTREVIRQFPPDELLEMARRLRSLDEPERQGFLIDRNI